MTLLNTLVADIQKMFFDGCPNGFLLKWDVNRFFQSLVSLFAGFKVINETDFNYSYCNSYEIELAENGEIFILTLKASFIADAYTVHLTKYSSNRRRGIVVPYEEYPEYAEEIKKSKAFFKENNFVEVENDEIDSFVENIDLELADRATVGKCLFDDFE